MNLMRMVVPFVVLLAVCWVASRLAISNADPDRLARETQDGRIEFLPNRRNYWGVGVILAIMFYPVVSGIVSAIVSRTGLWFVFICMGLMLLLVMSFPGSISAHADGLEQFYWLGHNKKIAWEDVGRIDVDEARKRVTIKGKTGAKVVYTRQLPDRDRFMAELQTHCPAKMPNATGQKAVAEAFSKAQGS